MYIYIIIYVMIIYNIKKKNWLNLIKESSLGWFCPLQPSHFFARRSQRLHCECVEIHEDSSGQSTITCGALGTALRTGKRP